MKTLTLFITLLTAPLFFISAQAETPWVVYEGREGAGHGKHIVIVTGDDEYRSEESMPQLGKILAQHHGFKVTVLFAIDPDTGEIAPSQQDNIPGLEALDGADLMILFTRFRELPDADMKHIIDYTNSGKPIMGLRTATHAFDYKNNTASPYAKYTWNSSDRELRGGYGKQVLGETWINHYGEHQVQSTRGKVAQGQEQNPIVKGCEDIWGASDVYGISRLSGDSQPLIMGYVLKGMKPEDEILTEKKPLPVAWTKTYTGETGNTAKVFTTTMGHSEDLTSEGFRRLLVNAAYWCLGLESEIPERANVELVGEYNPTPIGFGKFKTGVKPADHAMNE